MHIDNQTLDANVLESFACIPEYALPNYVSDVEKIFSRACIPHINLLPSDKFGVFALACSIRSRIGHIISAE